MKNHPVDTSRRERERERDVGWFDVGKVFCVRRRRLSEPEWARVRFKLRSNAKPALGRKQQIRCNEITSQLARLIRSPATRRNLLNLTVNRFFLPPPLPPLKKRSKGIQQQAASQQMKGKRIKQKPSHDFSHHALNSYIENRTTSPYNINAWIYLLLSFIRNKKKF